MEKRAIKITTIMSLLGLLVTMAPAQESLGVKDNKPQGSNITQRAASAKSPALSTALVTPHALVPAWAPPDLDAAMPPVAPDVACALPALIQAPSRRVKELAVNLERFTATERIEHWEWDKRGRWRTPKARAFEYVASITEPRPNSLNVEESRNGQIGEDMFPTKLASTGTAAFALIFHPYLVDDFSITCEGLGHWRDTPAWQIRFQQREDRPVRFRAYRLRHNRYPIKLKGRAWIATDSFQVLHLETDLAESIPAIRLWRDHLEIDYRPVHFATRNILLWLPESADIYMDFQGHRYRHRHSFSNYLLFSVDASQVISLPQAPPGQP